MNITEKSIEKTESTESASLLGRARYSQYSNDLFWAIWSLDEDAEIRWSGYNDGYWWGNVAPSDQFQIRVGEKTGKRYRLNPETDEVYQIN